jgi:hypothetical protein
MEGVCMNYRGKLTREEALEMFPSIGDALCAGYDIIVAGNIIIFGARCLDSHEDRGGKSILRIYPGKNMKERSC